MLIMKYGIIPVFESLSKLPFRQEIYAFLMCKKAYLDMKSFLTSIEKRENIFGFKGFW